MTSEQLNLLRFAKRKKECAKRTAAQRAALLEQRREAAIEQKTLNPHQKMTNPDFETRLQLSLVPKKHMFTCAFPRQKLNSVERMREKSANKLLEKYTHYLPSFMRKNIVFPLHYMYHFTTKALIITELSFARTLENSTPEQLEFAIVCEQLWDNYYKHIFIDVKSI